MKKLLPLLVVVFAAACSPKVITNISVPLSPLDDSQPVVVIGQGRVLPQRAQVIGNVEVTDSGFSTGCGYDQVVELARAEVRKAGGNYLYISAHRPPDVISSCHRIVGTIFLVDTWSPLGDASGDSGDTGDSGDSSGTSALTDTSGYTSAPARSAFDISPNMNKYGIDREKFPSKSYNLPNSRVAFDFGYSYRVGEAAKYDGDLLNDSQWREFVNSMRSGIAVNASFAGFRTGRITGMGLRFGFNHYDSSMFGITDELYTYYFAPEVLVRVPGRKAGSAWIFGASFGYVKYWESLDIGSESLYINEQGYKTTIDAGYDIRITHGLSLGFRISLVSGIAYISAGRLFHNSDEYKESLHAIEFSGGVRF
jgi:hypothetical protein